MKKLFLSVLIFIMCITSSAFAEIIYERNDTTPISKGITQTITTRFTDSGSYRIYTLKVDLNEEHISLKTLFDSKGINIRNTVLNMASEQDAIAAINADFFQPSGTNKVSPTGTVVEDGEMLSSPSLTKGMYTFAVDNENNASTEVWMHSLSLFAPDGEEHKISHINKYYDEGGLVLFTRDWGTHTPGLPVSRSEMIVKDDVVTEIKIGNEPTEIPEDGYVIVSTTDAISFLIDKFKVGDKVYIGTWFAPEYAKYKMAVGGGTRLLANGEDAPVTHNISGKNPRSAVGVDKSGKIVYLVAVDGRSSKSVGMTLTELRNYMRSIGCYNAMNFDGGGSTTFVTKEPDEDKLTVKNKVSDGSQRLVANSLGVMADAKVGKADTLRIKNTEKTMFIRQELEIKCGVYDEYYHSLDFKEGRVKYSVSGVDGYFNDNIFTPKESGTAVITAEYNGMKDSIEVVVRPLINDISDPFFVKASANVMGTKIAVMGNTDYSTLTGKLISGAAINKINNEADTLCLLGNTSEFAKDKSTVPVISGNYYYAAYKQNNLIIQINNTKKGLNKSEDGQWQKLLKLLEETSVKNVFVLLPAPLDSDGFSDVSEAETLKTVLKEKLIYNNKNVFVISGGNENKVSFEDDIYYFTVKGITGATSRDMSTVEGCSYILFTSNKDSITYQIKDIF